MKISKLTRKIVLSRRIRLVLLSCLVGIIAGLGAIALYSALYFGKVFFLNYIAGYNPSAAGGEVHLMKTHFSSTFSPFLLLIIPASGRIL